MPASLDAPGYSVRHAVDADVPRLELLYADTRADEMTLVPWPAEVKRAFVDQQFALQHQHYLHHHADADFLVIEHAGIVQGRYYLDHAGTDDLIVDICLMAPHRGRGVGRALIQASMREAQARGRGMWLHVLEDNWRARRLYESLGFVSCDGGTATHRQMRWQAPEAGGRRAVP